VSENIHRINYVAAPTIAKFHQDDTFVRGIRGPYGSGKSVGMCYEIMMRAQAMPKSPDGKRRSKWAVIRNTYRELKDTTLATWLSEEMGFPERIFGVFKLNTMTHYVRYGDVELDVMFRALDKPDDVKKLLSMELTGAWINEAREVPKAILDALTGRVGRFPSPGVLKDYWSGVIMDTNSPDTDHWWYKMAETPEVMVDHYSYESVEDQLERLHATYHFYAQPGGRDPNAENIKNLKTDYYTRMCVGRDPEWVKIYVDGQYGFITDGRPVYPEFNDTNHVSDRIIPLSTQPIIRGWDFGLTPACVLLQVTPRGQVLVFDELVSEDMGIERFSDVVIQHCKMRYKGWKFDDYGDPAGAQRAQTDEKTCYQILDSKNIIIEPGQQDLTSRLESVRKALNSMVDGRPGFQLHPRCDVLRKGFLGGYQYKRMQVTGTDRKITAFHIYMMRCSTH
jgi:phage terminase large subunit